MLDKNFEFSTQQALGAVTSEVNSTNVFDAGSAKKLFEGEAGRMKVRVDLTASGTGAGTGFRARLVGADDVGLVTNVLILAEVATFPFLTPADIPKQFDLLPAHQTAARRYYGLTYLQSLGSQNATVNAALVEARQSRLVR